MRDEYGDTDSSDSTEKLEKDKDQEIEIIEQDDGEESFKGNNRTIFVFAIKTNLFELISFYRKV